MLIQIKQVNTSNMYNLKYFIPFIDVDGNNYTIQILEENGSGSPIELIGGSSPFKVEIDDEDFLYTPTRFSGATIKIVGSDYLQNLFSTDYQKFKVNLLKDSTIVWTGFITPEIYSQDYDNSLFELEIECISALSTLEYIKFVKVNNSISIFDLLKDIIVKSKGDYSNIFIPITYGTSTSNILEDLTILTNNFIDEEKEPMNYKEILEEICKYFNWTIFEFNGNIYFIDVDYISKGNTNYFKYNNDLSSYIIVNLSDSIIIQNLSSKGSNNALSILGGYNKVSIIDSDYEVDSDNLYPELELKTGEIMLHSFKKQVDKTIYTKEYYPTNLKTSNYSISDNSYVSYNLAFNDTKLQAAGSVGMRYENHQEKEALSFYNWKNIIQVKQKSDIVLDTSNKYYLYKDLWDKGEAIKNYSYLQNYPIIQYSTDLPELLFDPEIKLCISFQIYPSTEEDGFEGSFNPKDLSSVPAFYIPLKLRIGDNYYNGSQWTKDSNNIIMSKTTATPTACINTWLSLYNGNTPEMCVPDLNGYIVHFDKVVLGEIELTIYNPVINPYTDVIFDNPIESFLIKDIKIESQRINLSKNKDNEKKDTIYSNVVNESYINQCDDIKFKITSKNDSELSYSKVIYNNALLDIIQNKITNENEKLEKILINRIVNQYKQPKLKLNQIVEPNILPYSIVTDNYLSGKKFIFTGGNIDYENNSMECNLIEIN